MGHVAFYTCTLHFTHIRNGTRCILHIYVMGHVTFYTYTLHFTHVRYILHMYVTFYTCTLHFTHVHNEIRRRCSFNTLNLTFKCSELRLLNPPKLIFFN